jgi:hypothetical protein
MANAGAADGDPNGSTAVTRVTPKRRVGRAKISISQAGGRRNEDAFPAKD